MQVLSAGTCTGQNGGSQVFSVWSLADGDREPFVPLLWVDADGYPEGGCLFLRRETGAQMLDWRLLADWELICWGMEPSFESKGSTKGLSALVYSQVLIRHSTCGLTRVLSTGRGWHSQDSLIKLDGRARQSLVVHSLGCAC